MWSLICRLLLGGARLTGRQNAQEWLLRILTLVESHPSEAPYCRKLRVMTLRDGGGPEVRNAKLVLCRYEYRKQCREGAKCTYAPSLQEVRPPPSGLLRSFPSTRYHYWDPKDPSGPPMLKIFTVLLDDPAFVVVAYWIVQALMEGSDVPEWCQSML